MRVYSLIVMTAVIVFGLAAINDWRARTYEQMHRRIAEAGATTTRSVSAVVSSEEAYFLALLGDFSGVALTGVNGNGPDCKIDASILRELRRYPEVTSLRLSQAPLKSADFQQIFAMVNLTRLNLSLSPLTDADLEGVEQLVNLDNLELQYTPLTDASVPRLARLSGLSRLDITGTDITVEGAKRLRKEYTLRHGASAPLVLHHPAPTPRYRAVINRLLPTSSLGRDLRNGGNRVRLQLRGESWKGHEQDIPLLAELTDVEAVSIQGMPLSRELVNVLAALPNLHHLSIADSSAAGQSLSLFSACRGLRALRLSGMSLDAGLLASLAKLESLETLSISNCQLAPGACLALADLHSLRSLHLRNLAVPRAEFDQLLSELENSAGLRLLDLTEAPMDNESVHRLARLKQLVSLRLGSKHIDDAAVPELCTFTHLQQLDITNTAISTSGIQNSLTGASQLEAALIPAMIRVVHPNSNTTSVPLNLADLKVLAVEAKENAAAAKQN